MWPAGTPRGNTPTPHTPEVCPELSGGNDSGTIAPRGPPLRRGSSRSPIHPAYAPLDDEGEAEGFGIHVQVRTRDSGHRSPLALPPTPHTRTGSRGCWSPFTAGPPHNNTDGGLCTPNITSPVGVMWEFGPSAPAQLEPLPPSVIHRALHGKCRFIAFPQLPPQDLPPPPLNGTYPLFIGQVRFETTHAELLWLFHRVCGASPLTIEGRGSGCFILHLKSETERSLVRQLHKRILFDIGGVWFARNSEEVDSLCEHVALDGPYLSKQAKLPRDSMVVEDIKVDTTDMTSCHPVYYNQASQFNGGSNSWGHGSSTRSTPTRAPYNSKPSSPVIAPLPPIRNQSFGLLQEAPMTYTPTDYY